MLGSTGFRARGREEGGVAVYRASEALRGCVVCRGFRRCLWSRVSRDHGV